MRRVARRGGRGRSGLLARTRSASTQCEPPGASRGGVRQAARPLAGLPGRASSKARYIDLTHTRRRRPARSGRASARRRSSRRSTRTTGAAVHLREGRLRGDAVRRSPPTSSAPSSTRRRTGRRSTRRIDELPATYAVRPLVVISIVPQVKKKADVRAQVADIKAWEKEARPHPGGLGRDGPLGLVEEVDRRPGQGRRRSRPTRVFPGVASTALEFLHLKRHILFHGHEPLDTDTTPTLEGESWLMHHGYTQAEGVDNLDERARDRAACSRSATRSSRAASAATPATSRSARPSSKHGAKISSEGRAAAEPLQAAALGTGQADAVR